MFQRIIYVYLDVLRWTLNTVVFPTENRADNILQHPLLTSVPTCTGAKQSAALSSPGGYGRYISTTSPNTYIKSCSRCDRARRQVTPSDSPQTISVSATDTQQITSSNLSVDSTPTISISVSVSETQQTTSSNATQATAVSATDGQQITTPSSSPAQTPTLSTTGTQQTGSDSSSSPAQTTTLSITDTQQINSASSSSVQTTSISTSSTVQVASSLSTNSTPTTTASTPQVASSSSSSSSESTSIVTVSVSETSRVPQVTVSESVPPVSSLGPSTSPPGLTPSSTAVVTSSVIPSATTSRFASSSSEERTTGTSSTEAVTNTSTLQSSSQQTQESMPPSTNGSTKTESTNIESETTSAQTPTLTFSSISISSLISSTSTSSQITTGPLSTFTSTPAVDQSFTSTSTTPIPVDVPSSTLDDTSTSFPITSTHDSISALPLSSSPDGETITSHRRFTTTTTYWTSTFPGGGKSTYSIVMTTGVLSTDTPKTNGFAHDTGAIIGVVLSGAFFLIIVVIFIFFACRRYKRRMVHNESSENFIYAATGPWRPPLDEDEYMYNPNRNYYGALGTSSRPQPSSSQGHSGDHEGDGLDNTSDRARGTAGNGSAESGGVSTNLARVPSFGGQPYMPGLSQTMAVASPEARPALSRNQSSPSGRNHSGSPGPDVWLDGRELSSIYGPTSVSPQETSSPTIHSQSAVSLAAGSSSLGHTSNASGVVMTRSKNTPSGSIKRKSGVPGTASAAPPTSFSFAHENNSSSSQNDRSSIRGLLGRFRAGRKRSSINIIIDKSSPSRRSHESSTSQITFPDSSLLNPMASPPVPPVPPIPVIHFSEMSQISAHYAQINPDYSPHLLGPGIRQIQPPSPVLTANSSMIEGLLDPHLGMALGEAMQSSSASLKDNVDYSRPISGLINPLSRSTTTFDTHDTTDTATKDG